MKWKIDLNNSEIPGTEYYIKFTISYADKYGKTYQLHTTGLWDNKKQKLYFEIMVQQKRNFVNMITMVKTVMYQ